jgi:quaternary ammonium compound-resistance protein SugE
MEHPMSWIYLMIAGFFEIGFASSLKLMDGHKNIPWAIMFYFSIVCSFIFLNVALKQIPIGTAYAVWTGIGGAGVAIVGILFFKDPATLPRIAFLVLLLASIIGLKLTS